MRDAAATAENGAAAELLVASKITGIGLEMAENALYRSVDNCCFSCAAPLRMRARHCNARASKTEEIA